jgi:hypothetical protein
MKTTPAEIREMFDRSQSWPDVFRELLEKMHPGNRTYVHLMAQLLRSCDVDYTLLHELQCWNGFGGKSGYTDEQLSQIVRGRIAPKAVQ